MLFEYVDRELYYEGLNVVHAIDKMRNILKKQFNYEGPFYLYHAPLFQKRAEILSRELPSSRFYYSVKSLSNVHMLKLLLKVERFGADVVSFGELYRAFKAGFRGEQIVFAGVGKSSAEIEAALENNIHCFHVESLSELERIACLATKKKKQAPIALRVNPDVMAKTHRHITTGRDQDKFGISRHEVDEALSMCKKKESLRFMGFHAHIGSQLWSVRPYIKTLRYLLELAQKAQENFGLGTSYLSLGGGFAVDYAIKKTKEREFPLAKLRKALEHLSPSYEVNFEPGRFISALSGVLVTKVEYLKGKKNYQIAVLDSGMNDLIRPALYTASHPILPVALRSHKKMRYDVVGPVCETADTFARKVNLNPLQEGDFLIIAHAGAYGSVMGSNYNSRPLLPEILYTGEDFEVIRRPQTYEDMLALELYDQVT
ncbi:MAG: diaminopimelate decarboxylase [Leptospiraceae bacterium]|nr:diaminopimelate decarboxylase [Leptospiraceae bacterium]MDW8307147.1 diaminopimelate decarboxylase [Leptospiraceae bacterium]